MTSLGLGRQNRFRNAIEQFLIERRDAKLEKLAPDDSKRDELVEKFQYHAWISDASGRVRQIQTVTHALKGVHPNARGTSVYCPPAVLFAHATVGSHNLPANLSADVVGNAAALDVYKFLKIEVDGKALLAWMLDGDNDLAAALSQDTTQAHEWMQSFANITQPRGELSSHTNAKQVYWLVGDDPRSDGDYHLLAPLYATSLAHSVYQTINGDRFGEDTKQARRARRDKKYHPHGYRDYPNLAVQKLGGTKPQNVSQLNSERGGVNYLLASLPPEWKSRDVSIPLNVDSVFPLFGRRKEHRSAVEELRQLLDPGTKSTMEIRNRRDELVGAIVDELYAYAAEFGRLAPGWSGVEPCNLVEAEQLWLDPGRTTLDPSFCERWLRLEWPAEIRRRFANWLNGQLDGRFGDVEHRYWSDELAEDPAWSRKVDADHRAIARQKAVDHD